MSEHMRSTLAAGFAMLRGTLEYNREQIELGHERVGTKASVRAIGTVIDRAQQALGLVGVEPERDIEEFVDLPPGLRYLAASWAVEAIQRAADERGGGK